MQHRTTLFISCILISSFINGQVYNTLVRDNVSWDVADYSGESVCGYENANRYFIDSDTLISGFIYKKIRQNHFISEYGNPFCPPFLISNESSINRNYFLREDSINRKVYAWIDGGSNEEEQLLYDFNLGINDTLHSEYMSQGATLIVKELDSVQLSDGSYRKRITLNSDEFYIESIGGSQGLFNPLIQGIGFWSGTLCVKLNNEAIWGNQCDYKYVGINDLVFDNVEIFPNPVKCEVNIRSKKIIRIQIFNINGISIINEKGNTNYSIDLSAYPSGIYIIKITDLNDDLIHEGKIINGL